MKLTFYGGAQMVTGANYLVETKTEKLLVDCGLFQEGMGYVHKNYESFPYKVEDIKFLLVTHSHLDHIGRIPKLVADGFKGKIISTAPTKDLSEVALYDSLSLMEEEAEYHGHQPLFKEEDLKKAMEMWDTIEYDEELKLSPSFKCRFKDAGHILGSAIIEVWAKEGKKERKICFTGDLGNPPVPILKPIEYIDETDYLVIESAYGNRVHEDRSERKKLLERTIEDTVKSGGVLMIPAFANERTQEILFEINELVENGRVPKVPFFIDSPLAAKITEIYKKYTRFYNQEASNLIKSGDQIFKFPGLRFTLTTEESKLINDVPPPKIIIAGSGMLQGGRILHHLKRYLPDEKSTLLFIGYQVKGSLGRLLFDGTKEVKIHNEIIPVRAKILAIGGYSAHADQEMLRFFVSKIKKNIKKVFVVQGEEESVKTLALLIKDYLAIETSTPLQGESFNL